MSSSLSAASRLGRKTSRVANARVEEDPEETAGSITSGSTTYQIGNEIGKGGFAIVYKALNTNLGLHVALKRFPLRKIDKESLGNIESEIELMQKLNHPNIVNYIETIKTKAYLYIVLELMEDGSLAHIVKTFGPFSEAPTAIFITQVLRGLKYLHEQGVLHRDIKGANILINKGVVKLADFGVAMKLNENHSEDQYVVGSPYWIAPEIINMASPTSACDIWSLGCTAIELLTGKPPYFHLNTAQALFRIVQDDYPPIPEGISQALRDFLLNCFQKEPAMRSSAINLLEHPWLQVSTSSAVSESLDRYSMSQSHIHLPGSASGAEADAVINTIRTHQRDIINLFVSNASASVDVHGIAMKSVRPTSLTVASSRDREIVGSNDDHRLKSPQSFILAKASSPKPLKSSSSSLGPMHSPRGKLFNSRDKLDNPDSLIQRGLMKADGDIPLTPEANITQHSSSSAVVSKGEESDEKSKQSLPSGKRPHETITSTSHQKQPKKFFAHSLDNLSEDSPDDQWDEDFMEDNFSDSNESASALGHPPMSSAAPTPKLSGQGFGVGVGGGIPTTAPSSGRASLLLSRSTSSTQTASNQVTHPPAVKNNSSNRNSLHRGVDLPLPTSSESNRSSFYLTADNSPMVKTNSGLGRSPGALFTSQTNATLSKFREQADDEGFNDFFDDDDEEVSLAGIGEEFEEDVAVHEGQRKAVSAPPQQQQTRSDSKSSASLAAKQLAANLDQYRESSDDTFDRGNELGGITIAPPATGSKRSKTSSGMKSSKHANGAASQQDKHRLSSKSESFSDDWIIDDSKETNFAKKLRDKLVSTVTKPAADEDVDEFLNYQFDEKDFKQNEQKDIDFRRSREVVELLASLRPNISEQEINGICEEIMTIFDMYPEQRDHLITYYGVMPIVDMFEGRTNKVMLGGRDRSLSSPSAHSNYRSNNNDTNNNSAAVPYKTFATYVLRVTNKIIENSVRTQEQLSLVGIIPTIMNMLEKSSNAQTPSRSIIPFHDQTSLYDLHTTAALRIRNADSVTYEAARFIHHISLSSALTLQMLIGAGGLGVLTSMVSFGCRITVNVPSDEGYSDRDGSPRPLPHQQQPPQLQQHTMSGSSLQGAQQLVAAAVGDESSSGSSPEVMVEDDSSTNSDEDEDGDNSPAVPVRAVSFFDFSTDNNKNASKAADATSSQKDLLSAQDDDDQWKNLEVFKMGINCIAKVFAVQSSRTRDFCRLFVKLGLLPHLAASFQNLMMIFRHSLLHANAQAVAQQQNSNNNTSNENIKHLLLAKSGSEATLFPHSKFALSESQSQSAQNLHAPSVRKFDMDSPLARSFIDTAAQHYLDVSNLESSVEGTYAMAIASLLFKFSCSDSVVKETMASVENGVIGVILHFLRAPELRAADVFAVPAGSQTLASATSSSSLLAGTSPVGTAAISSSGGTQHAVLSMKNLSLHNNTSMTNSTIQNMTMPMTPFAGIKRSKSGLSMLYGRIIELMLKCLDKLSQEPSTLEELEQAGTLQVLVPLLKGPLNDQCKNSILPCIYNMCRINRRRQDLAATLGIVPALKKVVQDKSPMKEFALPILLDFAHTSKTTRAELWKNDCVTFFVDLLEGHSQYWQAIALNSLAVWLANDASQVGQVLVQPSSLSKLIRFFNDSSNTTLQTLHKPLLDMISKSRELSTALSTSSVTLLALVKKLNTTKEAIVLRSLLRILQLLYQAHPDPLAFVLDNDLYAIVRKFAQAENQVLVCQSANRLLADFQTSMSPAMTTSATSTSSASASTVV